MLSDLIIKLHPRKNMPKTTVSDNTHRTAICTTRMTNSLRSSCTNTRDPPPSPVTTLSVPLPKYAARVPARVWLPFNRAPCVTSKKEPFMFPCRFPGTDRRLYLAETPAQHKLCFVVNIWPHKRVRKKERQSNLVEELLVKSLTLSDLSLWCVIRKIHIADCGSSSRSEVVFSNSDPRHCDF